MCFKIWFKPINPNTKWNFNKRKRNSKSQATGLAKTPTGNLFQGPRPSPSQPKKTTRAASSSCESSTAVTKQNRTTTLHAWVASARPPTTKQRALPTNPRCPRLQIWSRAQLETWGQARSPLRGRLSTGRRARSVLIRTRLAGGLAPGSVMSRNRSPKFIMRGCSAGLAVLQVLTLLEGQELEQELIGTYSKTQRNKV